MMPLRNDGLRKQTMNLDLLSEGGADELIRKADRFIAN